MAMSFVNPSSFSFSLVFLLSLRYPLLGLSMERNDNCSIAMSNKNKTIIPIPWNGFEEPMEKNKMRKRERENLSNACREFSITMDETNLLLTWLPPKAHTRAIRFFYLTVRFALSAREHEYKYFLLNVTGIDLKDKTFSFRCIGLSEKYKEVKAILWTRLKPAGKSGPQSRLSKNAINYPSESYLSLDYEAQAKRKKEYQCCDELVEVRLRIDNNQNSQVIVTLHTLPSDSQVEISLMNVTMNENIMKTWTLVGNGGNKTESLNASLLSPGKYKVKALKRCKKTHYTIDSGTCMKDLVESDVVPVADNADNPGYNTVHELPEAVKQAMPSFLLSSGLTIGILVGLFGVTSVIMICIANFFKTKDTKQEYNFEQGNDEKNETLGKESLEEETVAIIYMGDSCEYDKAVDIFEKMLNDLEVKAVTIRFDSTKLTNIIDFSESVCRSFKRFIVIISPDLYYLCHYYKKRDNTMYERILTKHCGQCLPVVFLNYLNQICFYGIENVLVYLVQFFEYGELGCDYMKMFVSDHLVLSTRFRYCLYKPDNKEELQLEEETVKALIRHLHNGSMPAITNGRNMDVNLKPDVKCELKVCAEALMAMLKKTKL